MSDGHYDRRGPAGGKVLQPILNAIEGLAYGEVHVIVHDSRVVRVERIERLRIGLDDDVNAVVSRKGGND